MAASSLAADAAWWVDEAVDEGVDEVVSVSTILFPPLTRVEYESEAEGERVVSADPAAAALSVVVVDEGVDEAVEVAEVVKDVEGIEVDELDVESDAIDERKASAADAVGDEVVEEVGCVLEDDADLAE